MVIFLYDIIGLRYQYENDTLLLVSRFGYGNGAYKTYQYDTQDQLISEGVNGTTARTYIYDKQGNTAQITDHLTNVTTTYTRDLIGRISRIKSSDGQTTNFIYDTYNRLSLSKWSKGETSLSSSYIYGDNSVEDQKTGLIYGVKLNGTQQLGYEYDELARLQRCSLYTTTPFATEYTYMEGASANTTTTLVKTVKNGNDTLEYTYDELGNITSVSKNGTVIEQYAYDTLSQLISATYGGDTYTYAYDNGGNLTEIKKNDEVIKTYIYVDDEWKDQLTGFNGETITYDEIGNPLIYRNGINFTWQNGRQLSGVTQNGSPLATYTYNADGLRNSKTVNGITTEYYWQNGTLYGQKTGDESIFYLYDENGTAYGFIYKTPTEQSHYYYEFNLQGDIIGIIDSTGTRVVEYTYGAWGDLVSITGTLADTIGQKNPLRYRGYYYDAETGFYYVSSRYYDPEIGRFLNADSAVSGTGESVQGYNLYSYCFNNPVNMSDPTGNWPKWFGKIINAVKKTVSKITNTIKKNLGITVQLDKEEPGISQYALAFSYENGMGYNKSFDTGKPVNVYKTLPNSFSEITKAGSGLDVNINGYGGNLQVGNENAISVHLKNASYELGGNILGRTYFKYSHMTDSGMYMYHKVSINFPEIGAGVLLYIFSPSLALVGAGAGTAGSLIAK